MRISEVIIREFSAKDKKMIRVEELKELCRKYDFDFSNTKKLMLNRGYFLPVFRGIYYLKDYNERKTGVVNYSAVELVSEGLRVMNIRWYFGLHTAIKLLGLTHEVFSVYYIINEKFSRSMALNVAGSKFVFKKMKPSLFFGIKKMKTSGGIIINCSNLEKTILDFVYLYKKEGKSDKTVLGVLREYDEDINKKKVLRYASTYMPSIKKLVTGGLV